MGLARYKLDLVEVQEVRWDKRHSKSRGVNIFFVEEKENRQLETGFCVHQRIVSAVKRVTCFSDRG